MKYSSFSSLVRRYAKATTTQLSDADITELLNAIVEDLALEIESANPTYFEKEFTINTVADQRNYSIDVSVLSGIKKVEWKKDTGATTGYIPVNEISIATLPVALQENEIRSFMSGYDPIFGVRGNELWLLTQEAIVAVVGGLKLSGNVYPQTIVSTWFTGAEKDDDMSKAQSSGAFGIPRQFHEILARYVSIIYKTNQDRPMPLSAKEQLFEHEWAKKIHLTKKQTPSFVATIPYDDGSDY